MGDTSRSMPTVARLYTQSGYRRASVKPGPGRALVLRDDAEREAREAFAAGVHAGRAEATENVHTEYPADIGIANIAGAGDQGPSGKSTSKGSAG